MINSLLHKVSFRENKRRYLNLRGIASGSLAYKGPDVVQIDLTDHCNSNCLVCWIHSPAIKNDAGNNFAELDYALVKKFISDIASSGTKEIIFSGGGEPFLYPYIWEILEFTQKTGLTFRINTNLTLLDRQKIKRLVSFNRLASLTVSVWSAEPGAYSRLHNRDSGIFYRVKDNLIFLNTVKPDHLKVRLLTVVNNQNYCQLEGLFDFASRTGCNALELTVPDVIPDATDGWLLDTTQLRSLEKQLALLSKHRHGRDKSANIANIDILKKRITNPDAHNGEYDTSTVTTSCYAGWLFLRLRANGDFNSCLKSHRIPTGNIYRDSFLTVWNNALQQEFRAKGLTIPKDKNYFSRIGNAQTEGVGCSRICDNLVANRQMQRVFKYLFWI